MKVTRATAYALHALMYMVRHATQLPVTTSTIAKAEGLPATYLAKIFQRLVKAGYVKVLRGRQKGYVFARSPNDIHLLDLFEVIEGEQLFDDCFLRHCNCGGTPGNCHIYGLWVIATKEIKKLLKDTSLEAAAWNHPDHRFYSMAKSLKDKKVRQQKQRPK